MDYFQAPDLGACCACGATGDSVRNIVTLDRLTPQPGTGWGCIVCNLPSNGALAVVCDHCLSTGADIQYACDGYAADKQRIKISDLPAGEFRHDLKAHKQHERARIKHSAMIRRSRSPQHYGGIR